MRTNKFIIAFFALFLIVGLTFATWTPPPSVGGQVAVGWVNITVNNIDSNAIVMGNVLNYSINTIALSNYIGLNTNNIKVWDGFNSVWVNSIIIGNILNPAQITTNTIAKLEIYTDSEYTIGGGAIANNAFTVVLYPINDFAFNAVMGESPQLSIGYGGYGRYDIGANILTSYQNFSGTSTPTGWVVVGSGASINNGVTILSQGGCTGGCRVITAGTFTGSEPLLDIVGKEDGTGAFTNSGEGYISTATVGEFFGSSASGHTIIDTDGTNSGALRPPINTYTIYSIKPFSSITKFSYDYGSWDTISSSLSTVNLGFLDFSPNAGNLSAYWLGLRAYYPNQPAVTVSTFQSGSSTTTSTTTSSTTTSSTSTSTSTSTSSTSTSTATTTSSTSTSTSTSSTTSATTTSSTSVSSTSTTSTFVTTTINANGLNVSGLGAGFIGSFNEIPYFGVGLILLAFGITFTRSRKLAPALFIAGLVAYVIVQINPVSIVIASTVTVLFIAVFIYEIFKSR